MFEGMRCVRQLLATGWATDGGPGSLLSAAIGHAIAFPTWRSLRHEQGLSNEQAVRMMVGLVRSTTLEQESVADQDPRSI